MVRPPAAGATREMRVFTEETFGPVTPVFKFSTEAEAVALANDTEFGLAAYFYTKDLGRAFRCAEALQYGMVGVNEVAITSEVAPFGGEERARVGGAWALMLPPPPPGERGSSAHAPLLPCALCAGVKHSGLGREHSRHGVEEYLDLKTVCMGIGA